MQRAVAFQLPDHGYRLAVETRRREWLRDAVRYLRDETRYRRVVHGTVLAMAGAAALPTIVHLL
jgi:hypothetical protein